MIGSLTVVCVELTVVVVPSTCKLPLMITSPSLLNPSGYGSMNILLSCPARDAIILSSIRMLPSLEFPPKLIKSPPITLLLVNLTFAPANFNSSVPFSSYSIFASAVPVPSAPPPNPRKYRQESLPHQNHLD